MHHHTRPRLEDRRRRHATLTFAGGALLLATIACAEREATAPTAVAPKAAPLTPTGPLANLLDGANSGNPHFYFLPPLVSAPAPLGVSDPSASPTVVVCEWDATAGGGQGACGAIVAQFSRVEGTGSEVVRYDAGGEQYVVNWKTDTCLSGACTLSATKQYRVRVLVGALSLGHVDVVVVSNGSELKNTKTGGIVALVNGRTLPIKFRIEHGAVSVVAPGTPAEVGPAGGFVASPDGAVALAFAPNAVGGPTAVTVEPGDELPPGAEEWSTGVELGPDGTTFNAPVTLTLAFDAGKLPPGVPPQAVGMVTLIDGVWHPVPGSVVNVADNTVSAPLQHFSYYALHVWPNTINGLPTGWTGVATGDSATAAGILTYVSEMTQRTCWSVRTWVSTGLWSGYYTYTVHCSDPITTVHSYPIANAVVSWQSDVPGSLSVDAPGTSVSDAQGMVTSPPLRAAMPHGGLTLRARYADLALGAVGYVVLNRFRVTPDTGAVGAGLATRFEVTAPYAPASDVTFSLVNRNSALFVAEPGKANRTYGGQTGAYVLRADSTLKLLALYAEEGPGGTDTLIVAAPGFAPDTAVLEVQPSTFRLTGLPAAMQVGDSAEVRLEIWGPKGEFSSLGRLITTTLAGDGLSAVHGSATVTSLAVSGRLSAPFHVKATRAGSGRLTISHPWFETLTVTVTVTSPDFDVLTSRDDWSARVGGPLEVIDFSTRDDGTPITNPGTDLHFPSLVLRGVEFLNVRSYYNQSIYNFPNVATRVALPPGTTELGIDLGPFYDVAGEYSIRLSTGAVVRLPARRIPGTPDFVGIVSRVPLEWVEFGYDNTYLVMDNFTVKRPPTPTLFDQRAAWVAAAGAGIRTIDFTTKDDGALITDPPDDSLFASLTLRGVEFLHVQSYWNLSVYARVGQVMRVRPPANTTAIGMDLGPFHLVAGSYTIRLSTGEVYTRPAALVPWTPDFFGLVLARPVEWIELSYSSTHLVVDNFSFVSSP